MGSGRRRNGVDELWEVAVVIQAAGYVSCAASKRLLVEPRVWD